MKLLKALGFSVGQFSGSLVSFWHDNELVRVFDCRNVETPAFVRKAFGWKGETL